MITIKSIYEDVALDNVNSAENANLSYAMFNRLSRRAELRMMDYLTGDIENEKVPLPYTSQRLKDALSPLIKKYPVQVENGIIVKPEDYYSFENFFLLGNYNHESECGNELEAEVDDGGCNVPIELLDGSKFYTRCNTFIEGLKPSFTKPIAKEVGNTFEFLPQDLGSITLEYIKLPTFGRIVSKMDTIYNEEVIDETLSVNYSWPEFARELLVFWITQMFSIHTREKSLPENSLLYGKLSRDERK